VKTFGAYIKELRQRAGISQLELADGWVSKGMISQIEVGKVYPSDDLLERLALRLQVSPDWLRSLREADQAYQSRFKAVKQIMEQGQWAQALELLHDCVEDRHPSWSMFDLQVAISRCLGHLGDWQQARAILDDLLRQALKYQQQGVKDVIRVYDALGYLAYECEGRPEIAIEEWERALQELEQFPRKKEVVQYGVQICLQLADVHDHLGDYQLTMSYYKQADRWVNRLEKGERKRAFVQVGMSRTLMRMGDYKKAEAQLAEAAEYYQSVRDQEGLLAVHVQQVVLMRKQGQVVEVADLLRDCMVSAEQHGDVNLLGVLRLEQAYCLQEAGDWQQAMVEAQAAYDLLQKTRQEAERLDVYRLLMQIHKAQEDYRAACFWGARLQERMQVRLDRHGYDSRVEKVRRKKSLRT